MGTSILRLRGLPYTATEAELVDFFSDWTVEATHICTRNGEWAGLRLPGGTWGWQA